MNRRQGVILPHATGTASRATDRRRRSRRNPKGFGFLTKYWHATILSI